MQYFLTEICFFHQNVYLVFDIFRSLLESNSYLDISFDLLCEN